MATNANNEALLREFPFLNTFFHRQISDNRLGLTRVTEELMNFVGYADNGGHYFYLINEKGDQLAQIGRKIVEKKKWYRPTRIRCVSISFEESVDEAIRRIGADAVNIRFILHIDNHNGKTTLYKVPKEFTLSQWLEKVRHDNTAVVQAAIAAIDNVGA